MAEFTPNICIDFDGVIHSYDKGWCDGVIYGDVVPGFFEWAHRMLDNGFKLTVYSSRSKDEAGLNAMKTFLINQGLAWDTNNIKSPTNASDVVWRLEFANVKPIAWLTIDDRAICFNGDWSAPELTPENIGAFRPWMNQPKNERPVVAANDERLHDRLATELHHMRQRLDARDKQVMGLIDSTIRLLDLVHVTPRGLAGMAGAGMQPWEPRSQLGMGTLYDQAPIAATTTGCQVCGEPTYLGCCNPALTKPKAPPVMPDTHEARAELQRKLAAAGLVPLVVVGKEGAAQAAQAIKDANDQIAALQAGVVDRFEPQPNTAMFEHVNHCPKCGAAYAVTADHSCE